MTEYLRNYSEGSVQKILVKTDINKIQIPFPSLQEQKAIAFAPGSPTHVTTERNAIEPDIDEAWWG